MTKKCVLYDDKFCNGCGECDRCDLDPSKICDNCGKCLGTDDVSEFRSVSIKHDIDASEKTAVDAIDAFLDEPLDFGTPEEIPIDPELMMQWEHILSESLKNDPMHEADENAPVLRAVRARNMNRKNSYKRSSYSGNLHPNGSGQGSKKH